MFHWICPECGREIPPSVRECPVCDPQASILAAPEVASPALTETVTAANGAGAALPSAPIEAVAASVAVAAAAIEIAEPIPAPELVALEAEPVPPAPEPEPLVLVSPPPVIAAPETIVPETVAVETSPAEPLPPPEPPPQTEPAVIPRPASILELPDPLLRLAQKLREAQRELESAHALAAASEPIPESVAPPAPLLPVEPEPQPHPAPPGAQLRAVPLIAPPSLLLLDAGFAPVALLAPIEQPNVPALPEASPNLEPAEPDPEAAGRVPVPDRSLAPPVPAPQPPALDSIPPASPSAPVSLSQRAPAAPALILAPLRDPAAIANRIRPASPATKIIRPDTTPRITLPGPALPPALHSLQNAGLSRILVDRPRVSKGSRSFRGLLVSVFVAGALGAGLLGLALYNTPRTAASVAPSVTNSSDTSPAPAPAAAPENPDTATILPAASTAVSYPLSKAVEVTGLRFPGDRKSEVHYLLVNHAPAELKAVTVYVTLRASSAKPGQPPLARFSFRAPALAAFESREMVATLDKPLHAAADWQSMRADIEVGQ